MAYDNYLNLAITWCEIDIRRMDAVRDFTVLCEIGFTLDDSLSNSVSPYQRRNPSCQIGLRATVNHGGHGSGTALHVWVTNEVFYRSHTICLLSGHFLGISPSITPCK